MKMTSPVAALLGFLATRLLRPGLLARLLFPRIPNSFVSLLKAPLTMMLMRTLPQQGRVYLVLRLGRVMLLMMNVLHPSRIFTKPAR